MEMTDFFGDVLEQLEGYYGAVVILFPKLVLGAVVLILMWAISAFTRSRLRVFLKRRLDDELLVRFILRVVKSVLIVFTLMILLNLLGLGGAATAIWGTAGVGAFVIGFAFKDIFEHFLAGFLLAFNRPFRIGDIVELDGNKGTVVTLSMRNTHIKTFDGQDVYIPNGNIIKNALKNYTIDGFMRQDFVIGLDYGSDVDKAIDIILRELNKIPGILKDEKVPSVGISGLGTSSLNLGVYYWFDTFNKQISGSKVKVEAVKNVLEALVNEGFYLPGDTIELKGKVEMNASNHQN